MSAVVVFLISATVVVLAGTQLSRHGDMIAEKTGLGGAWIGAVLLAGATSLPELSTDIFAVRDGNASLAIADLFGSSMINMLILALADLAFLRHRILTRVAINQALVGAVAISLTALAAAGMLTSDALVIGPFGWAPILIVLGYLSGMRVLHLNRAAPPFEPVQSKAAAAVNEPAGQTGMSLRGAVIRFAAAAVVILVAANFVAESAADLAGQFGLAHGFVGATLVALTTSLPEVTVTVASLRHGAYDLAVGNLLGSCAFNMVILIALDVADGSGSILASVDPAVLVSGLFAILLMGQTLIEVLNRTERRIWYFEPDAALRIGMYALGLYLVYQSGG